MVAGRQVTPAPVGFIIDSPWLPGWFGISTLDYYTSDELWLRANFEAIETFPEAVFIPGFWSEYGMCTEPSAFGAKPVWAESNLPHAEKIIESVDDIKSVRVPNVKTDGLLPFMINRLKNCRPKIEGAGHEIKFAVARGPLNIASFLMGTTELMMELVLHPDAVHQLLQKITQFTRDWLSWQKECCPTIDGILILDDIVGFVGDADFKQFGLPYLREIFGTFQSSVRLFHNDAKGLVCAPYLEEIGINMFNFSHEHSLKEIRELAGPNVALLGNIPPRDVLANGSAEDVKKAVHEAWNSIPEKKGILWSCGGGVPQGVSTENIKMFLETVKSL